MEQKNRIPVPIEEIVSKLLTFIFSHYWRNAGRTKANVSWCKLGLHNVCKGTIYNCIATLIIRNYSNILSIL